MNIDNCIARNECLLTPEEAQRKFERFEKLDKTFGEKRVEEEDSLIQNFASGMISGAISAPLVSMGPLGAMAIPSVMSAASGRIRNVQVLNSDVPTKLLTKSKHNKSSPIDIIHEPGVVTYLVGIGFFGAGSLLSTTPIGPILIGLGLGMMGSGISTAGEAGSEQARNRNRNRRE